MFELSDATIGVLTALPYEYAAVCGVLGLTQDIASSPDSKSRQTYKIGEVQSRYGGTHVVVAALSEVNHTHINITGIFAGTVDNTETHEVGSRINSKYNSFR